MRKVYLSGQITGLRFEDAKVNFIFARLEVIKYHGFDEIINPFNIKPFLGIKNWLCYMINDIREQRKCTHTAFQKNWINSRGAVIEYFFAKFIFNQGIIFLNR